MKSRITGAGARLKTMVAGFSLAQRTVAIIGVAVLVLGIAALGTFLSRPTMTPLFSGLAADDANLIVEQLRADGVSYELTAGGTTVLVPEQHVYEQRLKAASSGLPSSTTGGYSLLDNMGVTASEFQQTATWRRALEGELAATIGAMRGVNSASVKLAIPEESVFTAVKPEPTASVFVETSPATQLDAEQVEAIVHLAAASVDGMTAQNVTVIDASGKVLSSPAAATAASAKAATSHEERVKGTVQAMLDRILGHGNSTVAVTARVSNESAEVLSETFTTPDGDPALSESLDSEVYAGTGNGAGTGVLGPDNIAVPGGANGEGQYSTESSVRNNAINKVTENRVIPAGMIDRQTVSVAIDQGSAGNMTARDVQALVESAAGFDEERGDVVTVELVDFSIAAKTEAEQALAEQKALEEAARTEGLIRSGIIAAAVAIPVTAALFLFLRRGRQSREPVELDEPFVPLDEALPPAPVRPAPVAQTPAEPEVTLPEPAATESQAKRAAVSQLANQNPERAAELLRGLLDERAEQ